MGIDYYVPLADWRDGDDHLDAAMGEPHSAAYIEANVEGGEGFDWYYASDADRAAQVRTPISDGAYGEPWVFRPKDLRSWWSNAHHDRPDGVRSGAPTAWVPESKPIRLIEFGCPAVDKGRTLRTSSSIRRAARAICRRFRTVRGTTTASGGAWRRCFRTSRARG